MNVKRIVRRAEGEVLATLILGFIAVLVLGGGIGGCAVVQPMYRVYSAGKDGEAKLKEAESSRQIAVLEAKAKHEAAQQLAFAEIERAKGVAEANRIIGEGLKGNHEYLVYLWIHELANAGHVIYVPTEANLPILEAGRFKEPIKPAEGNK